MAKLSKIVPCLWFDDQAEEAAKFYVSLFPGSGIDQITHYGKEGFEIHRRPEGSVLTVGFHLGDQHFTALNGGPQFKFSEAISLQVMCEDQKEVDAFWSRLTAGGGQEGPCGWLKDKFGLSWQIVPKAMLALMDDPPTAKSGRMTLAMLQMKKLDLAALQRAYDGK